MKLLVRLDSLVYPRTGIGYYTEHLVRHLVNDDPNCEVTGLYMGKLVQGQELIKLIDANEGVGRPYVEGLGVIGKALDKVRPVVRGFPGVYAVRQKLQDNGAKKAIKTERWNIYHEPSFIPLSSHIPTIVTVHDLSHIRFPQYHPRERVKFLNRHLWRAIQNARHIITVSEFTKREVCHFFPEAKGKTTAIPLGVDAIFKPRSARETAEARHRWQLKHDNYILSVATQEPRKNLSGLIRAYLKLPETVRNEVPLVLVGGKGWRSSEFDKLISYARSQPGKIILTGRISRLALANLLSGCRVFAYPSFYEGFGLPIAEAQASGVSVLTTNYGAMSELAGDSAWLVDPNDFSADLLECLHSQQVPKVYSANNWRDVAFKTSRIYRSVLI